MTSNTARQNFHLKKKKKRLMWLQLDSELKNIEIGWICYLHNERE
jgi:hypothetical protein